MARPYENLLDRLRSGSSRCTLSSASNTEDLMLMVDISRLRNNGGVWEVTWKFEHDSFETLKTIAEQHSFKAGKTVFKEGDVADGMYLVLEGSALIIRRNSQGQEETVGIVSEDQSFGEIGLVTERPRAATVAAGTDLRVLKITRYALKLLQESAPDIALMIYQALARTLAEQLMTIEDMRRAEAEKHV